jgi:hypothetical protein
MPDGVELRLRLPDGTVPVVGNPVALRRMLLNLVVNGRNAAPSDGGWVEVALATHDDGAILEVSDNGPGVPTEYRDHLFEPFFSSRREGRGAGLGLAVVYAIVAEHRGEIELDDGEDPGARFIVRLPLGREADVEPLPTEGAVDSAPGARIVLVESDGREASRIIEALAEAGLEVRHAPTLAAVDDLTDGWVPEAVVTEAAPPDGDAATALESWGLPAVVLGASDAEPWPRSVEIVQRGASPDVVLAALQRLGVPVVRG